MRWRKLGHLFAPDGTVPSMRTHAAVPFAEPIEGDLFRIYFTGRDGESRSHTGSLVAEISTSPRVVSVGEKPLIEPGDLGCFDDSGAMLSWITTTESARYLYYIGWNTGRTVPFRNSLGLCIDTGSGTFRKYAPGPILDRTPWEPHFVASACVLRDGPLWRMWYLSCTEWRLRGERPEHRYHLKYATSADGIHWDREGRVAIDYRDDDEMAISRPSVIRDGDLWRMWYSHRGDAYRIGYAESQDGLDWQRLDHLAGIDTSDSGWDSEMIEYPHVFDHGGARYMLYNGNRYGETGFGLALLEV